MVFKSYQVHVLIRLILIIINCYGVTYVLQLQAYWFTLWNLILLLILQLIFLFRFLTRWQQDLKVFANSVRHEDYSITYHLLDKSDAHYELYEMLNNINKYVRKVKSEYVQQNHYFQYVVENAQVGLVAYEENGKVLLINQEALKLTRLSTFKNIKDLKHHDGEMFQQISALPLNQPRLIRNQQETGLKVSARLSQIVIDGKHVFLLSLLNIKTELEENELQSWQDLISVLTHEIMNSITPIHSLNSSMSKYLDKIEGNEETVEKARNSLRVINRRSQSLMDFVDRYRKISTVPLPKTETVNVHDLITEVTTLMQEELAGINLQVKHNNEKIQADLGQIEQVLINLLRNAIHALSSSDNKSITINTYKQDSKTLIEISDSGKGIPADVIQKIFIPFFTTREAGSGIGLTLSRQIMQKHGGAIDVNSTPGRGTKFTLTFNS